uniref:Bcl-2 Bcl-2 homology region 1-3 domain-containing protein n=1 Tax=Varanus komodoensis TaxID=61221 RepID=A0A8D2KQT4_VARKO
MAAEPGARQNAPSPMGPETSENISCILRIGKALLLGFIKTLWEQHTTSHPQKTSVEQPGREIVLSEEDVPDSAQVAPLRECMLHIWRELSNNQEITSMVESVTGNDPLKILAEVAESLFATRINWGRIVVFFYFAYRVIAQSSQSWFNRVIDWAMAFLQNRLAAWIQQQGGWTAILIYIPFSS